MNLSWRKSIMVAAVVFANMGWSHSVAAPPSNEARIDELIGELSDANEVLRVRASVTLGGMGDSAVKAVPTLISNLTDKNRQVSESAVAALIGIGPSALPQIIPLLSSREGPERYDLLNIVAAMGPKAAIAVPALVGILDSGFYGVGMVTTMWKGNVVVADFARHSSAQREGIREGDIVTRIDGVPINTVDDVVSMIRTASTGPVSITVRRYDVARESHGPPESIHVPRIRIDDARSRIAAIQVLGKIGPAAMPALKKIKNAIADTNPDEPLDSGIERSNRIELRNSSLEAVVWIDPPTRAAVPDLIRTVRESMGAERSIAIKKLGFLRETSSETIHVLGHAWSQMKPWEGQVVLGALGRISAANPSRHRMIASAVTIPHLQNLIDTKSIPLTAETAHHLLPAFDAMDSSLFIGPTRILSTLKPPSNEVIDVLAKKLSSGYVSGWAAQVLSAYGSQSLRAAPEILNALYTFQGKGAAGIVLRAIGKDAEPVVAKALRDGDKRQKISIIEFLADSAHIDWSLLVDQAKNAADVAVRIASLEALGRAHPLSMEISDVLGGFVENESREIRRAAIKSLEARGAAGARGLPALKKRLDREGPDRAVLLAAIQVIENAQLLRDPFGTPADGVDISSPSLKEAVLIHGPAECSANSALFRPTGNGVTTSGSETICRWEFQKKSAEAPVFGGGGQLVAQSAGSGELKLLARGGLRTVNYETRRSSIASLPARPSFTATIARDAGAMVVMASDVMGSTFSWSRDGIEFSDVVALSSQATALCLSPDGRELIIGWRGGSVTIVETGLWRRTQEFFIGGGHQLTSCVISSGSDLAILGTSFGSLLIRRNTAWKFEGILAREVTPIVWTELSIDGLTAATLTRGGVVRTWNIPRMKRTSSFAAGGHMIGGALSPDGKNIATVDGSGAVRIWDLLKKRLRYVLMSDKR